MVEKHMTTDVTTNVTTNVTTKLTSDIDRPVLVIANWKMHKNRLETEAFCRDLLPQVADLNGMEIAICPPFTVLEAAGEELQGSRVGLGAQNVSWERQGAFTGEISPAMLAAAGCRYVLIGHSERRAIFGEDGQMINRKLIAALREGLIPVLCVGEQLSERQAGRAEEVVCGQLLAGLKNIEWEPPGMVIAYEPVWAIGTGVNARPEDAQQMAAAIRACLRERFGAGPAGQIRILYGGSVKADNISEIMRQDDVDGSLVGGASLEADQFAEIARLSANG